MCPWALKTRHQEAGLKLVLDQLRIVGSKRHLESRREKECQCSHLGTSRLQVDIQQPQPLQVAVSVELRFWMAGSASTRIATVVFCAITLCAPIVGKKQVSTV